MSDALPLAELGLSQRDLQMARVEAQSKETSTTFDFGEFKNEQSPEVRINMAENYLSNADSDWARVYRTKSHRIFEETQRGIGEETKEEETKPKEEGGSVALFVDFVNQANLVKALEDQSDPNANTAREAAEKSWSDFLRKSNFDTISQAASETLDWIRQKAFSQEMNSLSIENAATPEIRQGIQQFYQSMETPLLHVPASRVNSENKDKIVILPDLLREDTSPALLLVLLAHERGHELLSQHYANKEDKSMDNNTQIVFEEFFPMLEERRMYDSLDDETKGSLPVTIRNRYEDVQSGVKGDNSDIPVEVLERAYVHSIDMTQRNKLKDSINTLYTIGHTPEQVEVWKNEMLKILHKHEPVGGANTST